MIRLSATALKDYVVCQSKWRYRKMRLKHPVITGPLIKGGAVHEVIEQYELGKLEIENMHYAYQNILMERLAQTNVELSRWDTTAKLLKSGQSMLDNYIEFSRTEIDEIEHKFEFILCSPWDDIDYNFVGKIDQIGMLDGDHAVIDIKTSRLLPTGYEILGDYQFTLYALAYQLEYGELPMVYNFHLNSGEYIHYPRDDHDIKLIKELMNKVIWDLSNIKQWEDHHKSKGWHCNRCQYRDVCYDTNRGVSAEF